LNTAGSGVLKASESVVLNGITNHGTLDAVAIPGVGGSVAILEDTINNTGTITTVGGNIQLSGPVRLTGGGGGATPEPATCFPIGAGLLVGIYLWRARRPFG
jgi:hypothetical protein